MLIDVVERDDWPRDKLLVRLLDEAHFQLPSRDPLSDALSRTTSKTTPSPSSATARKVTVRA